LTGPVKRYTQDYMAEHIIRVNSNDYQKFELLREDKTSMWDFFANAKDFDKLDGEAN